MRLGRRGRLAAEVFGMEEKKSAPKGFEELMQNLDEVVTQLESGGCSLEDALTRFEEGMKLSKEAKEILNAAEQRVEQLLVNRDGETRLEPVEPT
jgi:exodeoxyribonuclease VII small subunit